MQLHSLFTTLAIGAVLSIAPAGAQTTTPCEVYICMAGISGAGATGGPACASSLVYWHTALAVYSPYFNPPASALRRRTYLMTCPGAQVATNAALLSSIIATWGYLIPHFSHPKTRQVALDGHLPRWSAVFDLICGHHKRPSQAICPSEDATHGESGGAMCRRSIVLRCGLHSRWNSYTASPTG